MRKYKVKKVWCEHIGDSYAVYERKFLFFWVYLGWNYSCKERAEKYATELELNK